jgi:hypothetical protein
VAISDLLPEHTEPARHPRGTRGGAPSGAPSPPNPLTQKVPPAPRIIETGVISRNLTRILGNSSGRHRAGLQTCPAADTRSAHRPVSRENRSELARSRALATRRHCREAANRTSDGAFWLGCRTMAPKVCRLSGLWIEAGGVCPDFKSTAQVLVRLSPGLTNHRAGLIDRRASVVPAASHTDLHGAESGTYVRDRRGTRSARACRYASTLRTDRTRWAERTAEGEMGAHGVGGRQGLFCRCRDVGQESDSRRIRG